MRDASAVERLLKRDCAIAIVGVAALATLAWLYILAGAGLGMSAWEMTTLAAFPHHTVQMSRDMPGMDMSDMMTAPLGWAPGAWAL
ncbi:MAG: DUF2182 domain-containing protein, partial [Steroidobacteraceae bacterium]